MTEARSEACCERIRVVVKEASEFIAPTPVRGFLSLIFHADSGVDRDFRGTVSDHDISCIDRIIMNYLGKTAPLENLFCTLE